MARTPLINRVPQAWRRLDTDGLAAGLLSVMDSGFDAVHAKTGELFDLRSVDRCPDRFLPLLAPKVGYSWRHDKDMAQNREGIRHAIMRHSYKGSMARVDDTVAGHGITGHAVTDMASQLLVWGAQGQWGSNDCGYVAADYFHDGAFVLDLPTEPADTEALRSDLSETRQAGTRWYFRTHVDYLLELDETSPGWFGTMGGLIPVTSDVPVDLEDLNVGCYYPLLDGPLWLGFGQSSPWTDDENPPAPTGDETTISQPLLYVKCLESKLAVEVEEPAADGFSLDGREFAFVADEDIFALSEEWIWIYARAAIDTWLGMPTGTYRQTGVFVGVQGNNGHTYPAWLPPSQVTASGLGTLTNHEPLTIIAGDQRDIRMAIRVPGSLVT